MTTAGPTPERERLVALESLRGIAAVMIVLFHVSKVMVLPMSPFSIASPSTLPRAFRSSICSAASC